ncbi:MAG TPA: hypothetical protein VJ654_14660 [Noviherbaspirillum sp.]|nr:hypothetical protein [Noviherbaspirillum sp.]
MTEIEKYIVQRMKAKFDDWMADPNPRVLTGTGVSHSPRQKPVLRLVWLNPNLKGKEGSLD